MSVFATVMIIVGIPGSIFAILYGLYMLRACTTISVQVLGLLEERSARHGISMEHNKVLKLRIKACKPIIVAFGHFFENQNRTMLTVLALITENINSIVITIRDGI